MHSGVNFFTFIYLFIIYFFTFDLGRDHGQGHGHAPDPEVGSFSVKPAILRMHPYLSGSQLIRVVNVTVLLDSLSILLNCIL
jgi:hypothetical protein